MSVTYSSFNDTSTAYRLSAQTAKTLAPVSDTQASLPTIALDPSVTYQTWDGFGDSLENTTIYNLRQLTPTHRTAALTALFDPDTGNDFNLMRLTIGCADFCSDVPNYWTYDDNGGVADPTLANFSIQKDVDTGTISTLQQILQINPNVNFYSSLWSPPAWMKTTNSIIGTGTGGCPSDGTQPRVQHGAETGSSVDYYPALAAYYVKYLQAYAAQGIPITAVTLQNEPSINMAYPSTCFSPSEQADFAIVLKAAFDSAGLKTKIWGLDDNEQNTFPYSDATLANAAVSPAVDGLGFHNYAGTQLWEPTAVHAQYPDKSVHLTEITNGADKLVSYFRNWISSYTAWATFYRFMPGPGPGFWQNASSDDPDFYTPSLISFKPGDTTDYQLNAWYYTFGQFSRFIKPGAVRIDSTGTLGGNLSNVSFRNTDGTIVTVVVNRIPNTKNSVAANTPAQQFRVVAPDGQFTDTIPGDTVATYVYTPTTGSPVKAVAASASLSSAGYTAGQAVDGNPATVWTSGANEAGGQSFTIDLGTQRSFDQLVLNQGALAGDAPAAYQVSTSADGSTWTAKATGSGTSALTTIAIARTTARYVRVTQTGTAAHWWSIAEASVYDSAGGLLPLAGASATASSTSGGDVAANALDGSEGTRWSSGVAQAPGQTFTVDLGSARTVNTVELDAGTNSGDYPRGYSVTTSTNGTAWSSPVASGSGTRSSVIASFPATTARYLRVTQTGSASASYWSIAEFRAFDSPRAAVSRAGWSATASTQSASAGNTLDGSATSAWTTTAAQTPGQWFQIDLGRIQQTTGIDLDAGASGDIPVGYTVTTSVDGTNWVTAATQNGTSSETVANWPPAATRFVRVTTTGSSATHWWTVYEANLFAPAPTPAFGTPLPHTGWTAAASGTAPGSSAAGAIDGLLNTRWSDGSAQAGGEWFQVDLGAATSFSKIQLNAAGPLDNANGDYPRGYEVYVSNGGGWTLIAAGSGYGVVTDIAFAAQTARYINVHQTGTAADHYWSIAEFNVLN